MAELDDDMAMPDQEPPALPPAAALGLQQPRTPPRPPPWAQRVEQEALRLEAEAIVATSVMVTALRNEVGKLELEAALARLREASILETAAAGAAAGLTGQACWQAGLTAQGASSTDGAASSSSHSERPAAAIGLCPLRAALFEARAAAAAALRGSQERAQQPGRPA